VPAPTAPIRSKYGGAAKRSSRRSLVASISAKAQIHKIA